MYCSTKLYYYVNLYYYVLLCLFSIQPNHPTFYGIRLTVTIVYLCKIPSLQVNTVSSTFLSFQQVGEKLYRVYYKWFLPYFLMYLLTFHTVRFNVHAGITSSHIFSFVLRNLQYCTGRQILYGVVQVLCIIIFYPFTP